MFSLMLSNMIARAAISSPHTVDLRGAVYSISSLGRKSSIYRRLPYRGADDFHRPRPSYATISRLGRQLAAMRLHNDY